MTRFSMRFMIVIVGLFAIPIATSAAFVGPSQSPPAGNVPGVIWNRSTMGGSSNQQTGTEINISGSARMGGDAILADGKALRIDKVGTANLYIGNWGNGVQGLTVTVNGDLNVVAADTSEGKITAPKFCLGVDCITQWPAPVGGGGITSVTAGTGLTGGGNNGDVSIAFDPTYGDGRYVNITGDLMQGALKVPNPPVAPTDAAPKAYIDDIASLKVNKAGDTMGGALVLAGNPIQPLEAATKQYVDTNALSLSGGTMTGPLIVSGDPDIQNPNAVVNMNYFNSILVPIANNQNLYVKKAGDTMTGGLQITGKDAVYGRGLNVTDVTANAGVYANGITGVQGNGSSYGFVAGGTPNVGINVPLATTYGGVFSARYGVQASGNAGGYGGQFTNVGGSNVATLALPDRGGEFTGSSFGVVGRSSGYAGQFTNITTPTNITKLGGFGYAAEFYSAAGTNSIYVQRNAVIGGDLVATSNSLSACVWTAYVADGSPITCPAATPIMSGVQRSGATERAYCCAL